MSPQNLQEPDLLKPKECIESQIRNSSPIAWGTTRTIFQHKESSKIIKKTREGRAGIFQNIYEYTIWNEIERSKGFFYLGDTERFKKQEIMTELFARVYEISTCGQFLVMERLNPIPHDKDRVKIIERWKKTLKPNNWIDDFKPENFGTDMHDQNKVKMLDYGQLKLYELLIPQTNNLKDL